MTTAMKMNKQRLITILAIVLVLVGGLIIFTVWRIQESYRAVEESSKAPKKNIPQYTPEQKQDLADEVNKKYGAGDYQGAIELIESQKNIGDVNTQLLLAGAYANAGNYAKSLEIYKKLDDAKKLPDVSLQNMASIAEGAKDYRLAIDLYKRAKSYALSLSERNDDQIAMYDYQIVQLEKKL
jgi:tetratricopeptide (TPR) repeat protein